LKGRKMELGSKSCWLVGRLTAIEDAPRRRRQIAAAEILLIFF
jgi:hypothetical protein